MRRRVERHAGIPGRPVAGLLVPGWPGAGRGFQRHPGEGALARVGAASSEPATDGAADSQPRRQQGHPASPGMVPAPGLPQPLCPPRHVPLPSAGKQINHGCVKVVLLWSCHTACRSFNTCYVQQAHLAVCIIHNRFNAFPGFWQVQEAALTTETSEHLSLIIMLIFSLFFPPRCYLFIFAQMQSLSVKAVFFGLAPSTQQSQMSVSSCCMWLLLFAVICFVGLQPPMLQTRLFFWPLVVPKS